MPRRLIDDEDGMGARRHGLGDLGKMTIHGVDVAPGQDESRSLAQGRTDRPEDPRRAGALIGDRPRTGAALRPTSCQLGFLTDPRFVTSPEFDLLARMSGLDPGEHGGEIFLKMSCASGFWA